MRLPDHFQNLDIAAYQCRCAKSMLRYRYVVKSTMIFYITIIRFRPFTFEPDPDYSPDAGTGLLSPPVLRRGTVCRRTFTLHQHCVLSKICSRLICFCIRFNHQLNFE